MIFPEANFAICQDGEGLFFDSPDVNLDEDSLVVLADCEDGMGTIEFHRRHVIIHPANGKSKRMTVLDFIEILEIREE